MMVITMVCDDISEKDIFSINIVSLPKKQYLILSNSSPVTGFFYREDNWLIKVLYNKESLETMNQYNSWYRIKVVRNEISNKLLYYYYLYYYYYTIILLVYY